MEDVPKDECEHSPVISEFKACSPAKEITPPTKIITRKERKFGRVKAFEVGTNRGTNRGKNQRQIVVNLTLFFLKLMMLVMTIFVSVQLSLKMEKK